MPKRIVICCDGAAACAAKPASKRVTAQTWILKEIFQHFCEGDGVAGRVLRNLDLSSETTREEIARELGRSGCDP